ncbi:MAG TPA: PD-(D/E)XK nuclease family protein [Candidatus Polarisedimenticolia bacterium]
MPVYSHSRISSFENCPLQYRYRYIDRIKRDVEGVEAFVGKVVHEVLQALYDDLARARKEGAQAFTSLFSRMWGERLSPAVRIVREHMTLEDYRALGERCVRSFYDRYKPFDTGEVLGCETRVEFRLDAEGRYRMLGFIDRIDRVGPDVIEIHDYKTGSLPRNGALRNDRQLTLYEMALRERYPQVREFRHVWHYLAHDTKFVEKRTVEDLRKTRLATIRAIQTIEATADFPARTSALCGWCEYQAICPEWAGRLPARVEPAPLTARPAPPPTLEPGTGQYLLFGSPAGE